MSRAQNQIAELTRRLYNQYQEEKLALNDARRWVVGLDHAFVSGDVPEDNTPSIEVTPEKKKYSRRVEP